MCWRTCVHLCRGTTTAETDASLRIQRGTDGWKTVADQWLQPSSLAHDDFVTCYRWPDNTPEHFDPTVL